MVGFSSVRMFIQYLNINDSLIKLNYEIKKKLNLKDKVILTSKNIFDRFRKKASLGVGLHKRNYISLISTNHYTFSIFDFTSNYVDACRLTPLHLYVDNLKRGLNIRNYLNIRFQSLIICTNCFERNIRSAATGYERYNCLTSPYCLKTPSINYVT